MRPFLFLFASTAFLSNTVTAWGPTPHETIASLALRYLLPETKEWLDKLLPNEGSTDAGMKFISTWPDGYAHQCADGLWSKGLHFIDAEDVTPETITHPPLKCEVDYDRDCGNGFCVVGAIQNYTAILEQPSSFTNKNSICTQPAASGQKKSSKHPQKHIHEHSFHEESFSPLNPETLSDAQLATRFLVHFIGDIHQPLHAEGYDHGGNGIRPVYFKEKQSNLHALWDSQIPDAIFRMLPGGTKGVVDYLYQQTKAMDKSSDAWKNDWVGKCFEGIEAEVAKFGKITPERSEACAMQWAARANHYICTYVLQYGAKTTGMELSGDYTTNAKPIIVELVSMAGWRLGGWLNLLATQKLGLDLGLVKEGLAAVNEDVPMEVGEQDNYRGEYTAAPELERDEL